VAQGGSPARPERVIALAYQVDAPLTYDPLLAALVEPPQSLARGAPPFIMARGAGRRQLELATDCLAAAAYYEARSEGVAGQRAVVQVVLNRVRHPGFPATICGVVYQGETAALCQFSFTCDGSMYRPRDPRAWSAARRLAAEALEGYVYVPVGLATRFHTLDVRPQWSRSLPRVTAVGSHVFYLESGAGGRSAAFARPSEQISGSRSPA
jgi:hypothetical protein